MSMDIEEGKRINYFRKTEFKAKELTKAEAEQEKIDTVLRLTRGNEAGNKIIAILYTAGIDEIHGQYVKVRFKRGLIDEIRLIPEPEEEDMEEIVFKVERENLRDIVRNKLYEKAMKDELILDDDYWDAYRKAPEVLLKATMARLRGIA